MTEFKKHPAFKFTNEAMTKHEARQWLREALADSIEWAGQKATPKYKYYVDRLNVIITYKKNLIHLANEVREGKGKDYL